MKSILRENSIIPDTEEKEFRYNYCRKIFTRKTFDTHTLQSAKTLEEPLDQNQTIMIHPKTFQ